MRRFHFLGLFGYLLIVDAEVRTNAYRRLYNDLMNGYNKEIIPRCSTNDSATVGVKIALREILDLNEVEQTIKLNIWMRLKWTDCSLTWNTSGYDDINNIGMESTSVWTPDITLYESVSEGSSLPGQFKYRLTVSNDGSVAYNFPSIVNVACSVDVRYFPYDTQNCSLKFGSWSQHDIRVIKTEESADIRSFLGNNEWNVQSVRSVEHLIYYGCCPDPYSDVTYYLVINRKPKFYFLTLILPCMLILALAALGLILPSQSGEKMSLQITVLLSLAVFLLLISDKLPASAETFPIIGLYFTVSMILVTLSCFVSLMVLFMYYRDGSTARVPRQLLGCCRRINCRSKQAYRVGNNDTKAIQTKRIEMKTGETFNIEVTDGIPSNQEMTVGNGVSCHDTGDQRGGEIIKEDITKDWHELARTTDRVVLVIFVAISTITSAVFIAVLISQNSS